MSKKTFELGKIDYNHTGRRNHRVTAELNWDGKRFSATADVWNTRGTDIVMGGQCFDDLVPYFENPELSNDEYYDLFDEIYEMWKRNHLNDMHAGTPEQEEALKACDSRDYQERCDYLRHIGLYETVWNGEPYKYGHAWLYWDITQDDKERIEKLMTA